MIATHFSQQVNQWFVPSVRHSQTTAESAAPAQPAASEQVIVQPGDSYFFDAGTYRLRVLTGALWLPEHGILTAGEQLALCGGRWGRIAARDRTSGGLYCLPEH